MPQPAYPTILLAANWNAKKSTAAKILFPTKLGEELKTFETTYKNVHWDHIYKLPIATTPLKDVDDQIMNCKTAFKGEFEHLKATADIAKKHALKIKDEWSKNPLVSKDLKKYLESIISSFEPFLGQLNRDSTHNYDAIVAMRKQIADANPDQADQASKALGTKVVTRDKDAPKTEGIKTKFKAPPPKPAKEEEGHEHESEQKTPPPPPPGTKPRATSGATPPPPPGTRPPGSPPPKAPGAAPQQKSKEKESNESESEERRTPPPPPPGTKPRATSGATPPPPPGTRPPSSPPPKAPGTAPQQSREKEARESESEEGRIPSPPPGTKPRTPPGAPPRPTTPPPRPPATKSSTPPPPPGTRRANEGGESESQG